MRVFLLALFLSAMTSGVSFAEDTLTNLLKKQMHDDPQNISSWAMILANAQSCGYQIDLEKVELHMRTLGLDNESGRARVFEAMLPLLSGDKPDESTCMTVKLTGIAMQVIKD